MTKVSTSTTCLYLWCTTKNCFPSSTLNDIFFQMGLNLICLIFKIYTVFNQGKKHGVQLKRCNCFNLLHGSHSSWKTWKNDNSFSSPGKVLEFYNFIKNPGKMGVNLEK